MGHVAPFGKAHLTLMACLIAPPFLDLNWGPLTTLLSLGFINYIKILNTYNIFNLNI